MRYFASIPLILALLALPAAAQTPASAPATPPAAAAPGIALPLPPAGTCPVDSRQDADRNALSAMHLTTQAEADMKALFAECAELQALRLGKTRMLTQYGDVLVSRSALPAGLSRAQAMALFADAAGLSGAVSSQMINSNDPSLRPSRSEKIVPPSVHKVLKKSDTLLVIGSEQRHVIPGRAQYAAAAVSGVTVVGNQLVVINLFAPMAGEQSLNTLAGTAESYLTSLLAANP